MKITCRQLRGIIRQELTRSVHPVWTGEGTEPKWFTKIVKTIDLLYTADKNIVNTRDEKDEEILYRILDLEDKISDPESQYFSSHEKEEEWDPEEILASDDYSPNRGVQIASDRDQILSFAYNPNLSA